MSLLQLPAPINASLINPPRSLPSHFPHVGSFVGIYHQNPIFSQPSAKKGETLRPVDATMEVALPNSREGSTSRMTTSWYALPKKMSAEEVQDLVRRKRDVPLVIDFYATWCGPCIQLEMLAVEREKNAIIVKVDTDDEYEFARDMQVRGLPTLYFISPRSKERGYSYGGSHSSPDDEGYIGQ